MRKLFLRISILAVGLLGFAGFMPVAYADCNATDTASAIQCGTNNASGVPSGTSASGDINNTVSNIINILSLVVGVVAVIMIIVAGFRYITSGGDSAKVTSAKNALLFAVIGLIIVALAQVIARFVLRKATK